ncbi:MAG: DUF3048 domain-containing protein [Candidatus Saccharimonadales bacterium]
MDIKVRRPSVPQPRPQTQSESAADKDEPKTAPFIDPTPAKPAFQDDPPPEPKSTKSKRKFHLWPTKWSKKKKRIFTGLLLVVIIALIAGGYYYYQQTHKPKAEVKAVVVKEEPPKPTTEASRLTGLQISPQDNQRAVTGVMIENSPDARPQAGLADAGVVYEAVAEGGITRFLALYMEGRPAKIGPIRSSRPYYLDWLMPYDASYAHVGGSPDALAQIRSIGIKDLDQFYNSAAYERSSQRYAPHNVYSSIDKLYDLAQNKGYKTSTFTSWPRKDVETASATPNATSIDLAISSYLYNAHYDYDRGTNSYKRSEGGKPHIDENSNAQLTPKVVVALVMPSGIAADGTHTDYTTVGSGPMSVFQDGVVIGGTWKKESRTAQFTFTDGAGQPLKLNPGQTWVSIVNTAGSITYKP